MDFRRRRQSQQRHINNARYLCRVTWSRQTVAHADEPPPADKSQVSHTSLICSLTAVWASRRPTRCAGSSPCHSVVSRDHRRSRTLDQGRAKDAAMTFGEWSAHGCGATPCTANRPSGRPDFSGYRAAAAVPRFGTQWIFGVRSRAHGYWALQEFCAGVASSQLVVLLDAEFAARDAVSIAGASVNAAVTCGVATCWGCAAIHC
jgi:hypothetical protein